MKVLFITLGCKVNQYETEAIREKFEDAGYESASGGENADIVIINSCTVTAESDRKTRKLCRKYRRLFPSAVLVLIGCMAQAFPDKAEALDCADIILGNRDAGLVLGKTEEFLERRVRIVEISPHTKDEKFNTPAINRFEERTRAFMKIEDGCQRYCSYCIIPTARGIVRSKPIEDIKKEAAALAGSGYKEIVLVGINLSAYGSDTGSSLCDAVEAVCAVDGIKRVRLGSLEPDHLTDSDLERLAAQDKFCPQFHLSLQSGCDATLRRMNRHYDTDFYSDLVKRIRKIFNNPSITTDVMVGFAGETDEDFKASADYIGKLGFARCHVFAYSKRSGTKAAEIPDQVSESEKRRRAEIMGNSAKKAEAAFLETQTGTVCTVLFEQCDGGVVSGYTENYTHVKAAGSKAVCGTMLPVKITGAVGDFCTGEILEQDSADRNNKTST